MFYIFLKEHAHQKYNQFYCEGKIKFESAMMLFLATFNEPFNGKKRLVFTRYKSWSHQSFAGQEFVDNFILIGKRLPINTKLPTNGLFYV